MHGFLNRSRDVGVCAAVLSALLERAERWFGIHVWVFCIHPMSPDWVPPVNHAARFKFRSVGIAELLIAAKDPALELGQDFVVDAYRRGDICSAAFVGDRLVGYSWYSTSDAPGPNGLRVAMARPELVYGYKTFVHPEFRGQRLNTSLVRWLEPELRSRGYSFGVGYVALRNTSSLRAYFKNSKFRRIGYAVLIDWPGVFFPICSRKLRGFVRIECQKQAAAVRTID